MSAQDSGIIHTFRIRDGRLEYVGPMDEMPSGDELSSATGIRVLAEDGSVAAQFSRGA